MILLRQKKKTKKLEKRELRKKYPKFYCDYLEKINPLIEQFSVPIEVPEAIEPEDLVENGKYTQVFSYIPLYCKGYDFYIKNYRKYELTNPKVSLHSWLEDLLLDKIEDLSNKDINLLKKVIREIKKIQV